MAWPVCTDSACKLHEAGKLSGVFALVDSSGASVATPAMRVLPIGPPKLLVSTVDAEADQALIAAVEAELQDEIERHRINAEINDPAFTRALAERLIALLRR